ncbi:MAG: ABC-2 family transporter protein [Myxococcaceae bacterium]
MRNHLRLLMVQLRASALLSAQYRADFFIDGIMGFFWVIAATMPLFVAYGPENQRAIPGWTFGEALLVVGCFTTLQAIIDGAINPGLSAVVDHIRQGTLDFILLKPADSQFLVSTARFQFWRFAGFIHAAVVFGVAFHELGRPPPVLGVVVAVALLGVATLLLYSLWILIVSTAFVVVKVDNLTYLFGSIFDAARWPASVFRGALKFVFTFVIPLTVMTTFPAEALLDRLDYRTLAFSVGGSLLFVVAARLVWLRSIRFYTSAGG